MLLPITPVPIQPTQGFSDAIVDSLKHCTIAKGLTGFTAAMLTRVKIVAFCSTDGTMAHCVTEYFNTETMLEYARSTIVCGLQILLRIRRPFTRVQSHARLLRYEQQAFSLHEHA